MAAFEWCAANSQVNPVSIPASGERNNADLFFEMGNNPKYVMGRTCIAW
jgi:hypothetical protein